MKNEFVTVTKSGNGFTYQHQNDEKPMTFTLNHLLTVSSFLIEQQDRNRAALHFLREAVEAVANTSNDIDQYSASGIAAICDCIQCAIGHDLEEYRAEFTTIQEIDEIGLANM